MMLITPSLCIEKYNRTTHTNFDECCTSESRFQTNFTLLNSGIVMRMQGEEWKRINEWKKEEKKRTRIGSNELDDSLFVFFSSLERTFSLLLFRPFGVAVVLLFSFILCVELLPQQRSTIEIPLHYKYSSSFVNINEIKIEFYAFLSNNVPECLTRGGSQPIQQTKRLKEKKERERINE